MYIVQLGKQDGVMWYEGANGYAQTDITKARFFENVEDAIAVRNSRMPGAVVLKKIEEI